MSCRELPQGGKRVCMRWWMVLILAAGCAVSLPAQSDSFTPMALDSGFGRMDLTPPSIPPEQIIKQFSAKETEFREALNHYTYRPSCPR